MLLKVLNRERWNFVKCFYFMDLFKSSYGGERNHNFKN